MTDERRDEEHRDGSQGAEPGWRPTAREVFAILIFVIVLVFALVNTETTNIDFVFAQVTTPVFFVIAFPALLGFIAGLIVQRRRLRRRRG